MGMKKKTMGNTTCAVVESGVHRPGGFSNENGQRRGSHMSAGWLGLSNSPPLKMLAGFFLQSQVSLQDNWIFIAFIHWLTRMWCEGPRQGCRWRVFFQGFRFKASCSSQHYMTITTEIFSAFFFYRK